MTCNCPCILGAIEGLHFDLAALCFDQVRDPVCVGVKVFVQGVGLWHDEASRIWVQVREIMLARTRLPAKILCHTCTLYDWYPAKFCFNKI